MRVVVDSDKSMTCWFNATKEVPLKDEETCILIIEDTGGNHVHKMYNLGYIFNEVWYDLENHERIEYDRVKVTKWMYLPEES